MTRGGSRGLTLLEVLVSIGIVALIATLVYGAFDGMSRARSGLTRIDDRYHQGRSALARMTRELQSAFLSAHQPLVLAQSVRTTAFIGLDERPADRLDFTSFSHRKLERDAHESDQNELGYFGSDDRENRKLDLVRREAKYIDLEPDKGGIVQVLCEDIASFDVEYLDPVTGEWVTSWDSTQAMGQLGRLPLQVKLTLVLNGGMNDEPLELRTRVPIAMQTPLAFGIPTTRGGGGR